MNFNYKNIINSSTKTLLKGSILIVHYFTRTPLIILYYFWILIGLFGQNNALTNFCFRSALFLVMINILLVLIFNWSFTKDFATLLVGKPFCDRSMTHSAPAIKSLLRLGTGIAVPTILEMATSWQNSHQHNKVTTELRDDIERYYGINDVKGVRDSQQVLNKRLSEFKPGGLVKDTLRSQEAQTFSNNMSDVGQTAIKSITSIFKGK